MPAYFKYFFFAITGIVLILSVNSSILGATLSPSLNDMLDGSSNTDSVVSVIVFAEGGSDAAAMKMAIGGKSTLRSRHETVVTGLKRNNSRALDNIKDEINRIAPNAIINEYWIAPAFLIEVPISKVSEIASVPGVSAIMDNAVVEFIKPVDSAPVTAKISQVYNHITSLNIPALWNIGLTGRGRLVCSFDTGVDGTHEALADKWRGNISPSSDAFFAPSSIDTLPFDKTGHGTHTMGLMVGSAAADSFGVAPGAEWITAAVIDQGQTLSRTISDILAAFEWAVDPDGNPSTVSDMPDVILNSWGIPITVMEPCDATFDQVIDNVEAAGIVTIFAAGNEGPEPQTLRLPANRASSPLTAFAVGAIDQTTNVVASFSSRGPSSCDTTQIKPEVVAPGVNLYSCAKGGGYTLKSGTSMAAPLIAGMVVLLRQYNPDATVDQIKNAIIQSALDLGPFGEDNDYGYGLPDAYEALSFIPAPAVPDVYISEKIIGGDGFAEAGETFDLYIRLEIPGGITDTLTAFLGCESGEVDIIDSDALFFFDNKGIFSVNISPFIINFDSALVNGQEIEFDLYWKIPFQQEFDTLSFTLTVGHELKGNLFTHHTASLEFTVSDFGQYGFGAGSIYPAGGAGMKFRGSDNLLYEAGIIVGRNSLQLSSSVRDESGAAFITDFGAMEQLSTVYTEFDGRQNSAARFDDTESEIPIPITVNQSISSYDETGEDGYVIFKYRIVNSSNENLSGLYFGYLCDFDLSEGGDVTSMAEGNNLSYQSDGYIYTGVMPLTDFSGMHTITNAGGKTGLTEMEKFNYISAGGIDIDRPDPADYMNIVSFGPFNLSPGASVEVCLAVAAGGSLSELETYAIKAREKYNVMTDVDEPNTVLPTNFDLHQNYPNPFNPATVISFDIDRAAQVELSVYNMLGRKIRTLFDEHASAGSYSITWDGTDSHGQRVASGVYFYRLESADSSDSKKMLLLK